MMARDENLGILRNLGLERSCGSEDLTLLVFHDCYFLLQFHHHSGIYSVEQNLECRITVCFTEENHGCRDQMSTALTKYRINARIADIRAGY